MGARRVRPARLAPGAAQLPAHDFLFGVMARTVAGVAASRGGTAPIT
ncbi:hypothetical protein [Pseudonocardia sp. H11422]|nr:hypothetical protein [Pseudonocardia sp. H11422]